MYHYSLLMQCEVVQLGLMIFVFLGFTYSIQQRKTQINKIKDKKISERAQEFSRKAKLFTKSLFKKSKKGKKDDQVNEEGKIENE